MPAGQSTETRSDALVSEDTLPIAIATRLLEVQRPPRATRWDDAPVAELARASGTSVCERFARRMAEFALRHPDDPSQFLGALQEEVVGGTDDPFELERGLREGTWNRDYFYAGHGGFRPEFDDAERNPRGGNHQPGHFVSVLSIAARFGESPALIALAQAGDYSPGEEDDLRLSLEAIEMGVGLTEGTLPSADVARRVRGLCRQ
ncbi:MAG TPA: hypothetical protein VGR27_06165 [Longimicrobiaceae bacterium]|nr:hypothetical protein [Longimicrobiaceae bacterium]